MAFTKKETKNNKMLKIKRRAWRGWARLGVKALFIAGMTYALFGVLFGISRGVGVADGSLLFYCRICKEYMAGDVLLMNDGRCVEYESGDGGLVAGKIIAQLSVRRFAYEVSE